MHQKHAQRVTATKSCTVAMGLRRVIKVKLYDNLQDKRFFLKMFYNILVLYKQNCLFIIIGLPYCDQHRDGFTRRLEAERNIKETGIGAKNAEYRLYNSRNVTKVRLDYYLGQSATN